MTLRSRISWRDLGAEALAGLLQRPGRSALTALGTVLGVSAFVAVLGITGTAGNQIDERFTALAATQVVVEDVGPPDMPASEGSFGPDSSARVQALNGVVHAGVWWPVPAKKPSISAAYGVVTGTEDLRFLAVEDGALSATHPKLQQGRLYDRFHSERGERVAVLGAVAASRLGVTRLDGQPAVFVDERPYTVIGIVSEVDRLPEALFSVMIPLSTAESDYGMPEQAAAKMLIETRLGAATVVAEQVAVALRPEAPERFRVISPVSPRSLHDSVLGDVNLLFVLLATISLVIGAFGIANTTLVGILERTSEIGLRRSLGARRWHIGAQFIMESTILGLLGGLVGTSLGVITVVIVSLAQQWTAVIAPWIIFPAPLVGAAAGLVAGIYPAWRAAATEPVEALRRLG
ncbi:ABC transporter permease [Micromonospora sp. C31]|uniref:ABC transporter permease n=1 Tax=Micromonospora sp. C31 TaxID=2824876 RepID=UPI001B3928E0|nr:ABC transporter permease [Micromonospora sp. C31]MBQ1072180.1 ABC transporter permease [Micromonospora sp. C31]